MTEIYECECGKTFKSRNNDKKSASDKFNGHIHNVLKRHGLKHSIVRAVIS